jgi:Fe-Mn family superoxide dismutase
LPAVKPNLTLRKELLKVDAEANAYALGEVQRRFGFEYNGMRNHEVYFDSLSEGATDLPGESELKSQIEIDFRSFEGWLEQFKATALTRGIGWAMLYHDRKDKRLLNAWIDEQHLGQLQDCTLILALDMWEHSYVADYQPSGKKQYVEDFFANLNWQNIERNFMLLLILLNLG